MQSFHRRIKKIIQMKKILSILFLIFLYYEFVFAVIIKPSILIKPSEVVLIQLNGLMKNDDPKKNSGIKQTWMMAHPFDKKNTGPLPRFIKLLQSDSYRMLLNHLESQIVEVFKSKNRYRFEVTILGNNKNYYKFQWIVEKYYGEGALKDCWLTISVSNPVSLGSSI